MEKNEVLININDKDFSFTKGITIGGILEKENFSTDAAIIAASVNNKVKTLNYKIEQDCKINFIDLSSELGNKIYQQSISFVLLTATKELYPKAQIKIQHSLADALYGKIYLDNPLTDDDVWEIKQRMQEIITENRPIIRKVFSKEEAIQKIEKLWGCEKVTLINQLEQEEIPLYYCGEIYDYLYSYVVDCTGVLSLFDLKRYRDGFLLSSPNKNNPKKIKFKDLPRLANVFEEAEEWGNILKCGYVSNLNKAILSGDFKDVIRISEALHEKKIAQIADYIKNNIEQIKIILIAGPSSSGKTTFARRLGIQLRVNGIEPSAISLDDYFLNHTETPLDEFGKMDFESIEALDLELFNKHLIQLLNGEEVEIPRYNFVTGSREAIGHKMKINPKQPIIIEGIHGLNEKLTKDLPRESKFKIYISALTQLALDSHNRISTTDARLLRRMVRDHNFRGNSALGTLQQWASVRRGEEKNIFPYQEDADIMFNSALIYELAVLKKYAEELLIEIHEDMPEYVEAKRLLNFLSYFYSIVDEKEIPATSILREFIGII